MSTQHKIQQINAKVMSFYQSGDIHSARQFAEEAYTKAQEHLLTNSPSREQSAYNLAFLLDQAGEYFRAEKLYQESLLIQANTVGATHPRYTITLKNLSVIRHKTGDYAGEVESLSQLLEITQKSLGPEHNTTHEVKERLVKVHLDHENQAAAEALYLESIDLCRALGHRELAYALYDLGKFYEEAKRYPEAENTLQQALELDQQVFGPDSLEVAQDLNSLAMLYEHTQRLHEAEAAYVHSIEIKRRTCGQVLDSVAIGLHNLANFYRVRNRHTDAELLLLEALKIRRQIVKENHPDFARILTSLGNLYLAQGNLERAIQTLAQARSIYALYLPDSRQAVLAVQTDLALAMFRLDKLQQAEGLWFDVLKATKPGLGAVHAPWVAALEGLSDLYERSLDFPRARQIMHSLLPELVHQSSTESQEFTSRLQSLVRVVDQVFPIDESAFQLFDVGEDFYNLGEYAIALALYQESRRRLSESDHLFQVVVYAMANMHRTLGNYAAAEALLRHSMDLYATSEIELRDLLDVTGSAQELNAADLVDFSGHYSASAELLGSVLTDMGRYEEARVWYQKALDIKLLKHTQSHPSVLITKQKIANLCQRTGDYGTAKRLLDEVLQHARDGGIQTSEALANLLSSAGGLYTNIGDIAKAGERYAEALQIARLVSPPGDSWLAVHLNNLGYHFLDIGQIDKARPLLEEACELWRSTLGPDHPNYAEGLINLANLYERQGDVNAAGQAMAEALRIRTASFGFRHPATAQAYNNLGNLYLQIGSYAKAESLLQLALNIRREVLGSAHPSVAITQANLITLYADQDRLQEALQLLQQQSIVHSAMIGQIFPAASERQRLALLALLQPHMRSMLWVIWRIAQALPLSVPDCFDLLAQRKGISQEALAVQQIELLKDRYPARIADFQRLVVLRQQIAALYLKGPSREASDAHTKQLIALEADKEKLEIALAQHIPELNIAARLQQANRKLIAARLPPDSALIEFAAIPNKDGERTERYLAFVLPAGQPDAIQMIDLGDAKRLGETLATWRSVITGHDEQLQDLEDASQVETVTDLRASLEAIMRTGGSRQARQSRDGVAQGAVLRELVFDPLVEALGTIKRLFIAPDGDLSRLPFEALPLDQDRYVLDDYQISYLSVGRDILRVGLDRGRTPETPLVLAAPDYDMGYSSVQLFRSGHPFTHLDGLSSEGKAVAAWLHASPLLEKQALKNALKNHPSPVILHLATHGFFLDDSAHRPYGSTLQEFSADMNIHLETMRRADNPLLRSGLALAGANVWAQGGDLPLEAGNGILTAEDVTGLDLLGTELAVLSACETGLGQVKNGEGVFGLQRAFVIAGAKALVMSLWKVPDKQTSLLMELFYQNMLEKGLGRAEALRQAQLALRKQYPKRPRYWGAFICQGNPGPLPESIRALKKGKDK